MYKTTGINITMIWFHFMVLWWLLFTSILMVCLQFCLCSLLCICFNAMCVYALYFMLNVWSLWEEKYEFQLFLILRIPARSSVKVRIECIDRVLSFISEKLRRDIVFLITVGVQVSQRVVQGVHRRVEVLYFSNWGERLKNYCCREVHRVGYFKQPEVIVNATRSARKNPFEALNP